jgi:MFS family permease
VPLFLQATTHASPTQAGLLLVPMMAGITVSTTVSGRISARTGRYKPFPIAGLALMTGGLAVLALLASDPSRTATGAGLVLFGLGFGMVGQMLIVAVQNSVERRELGVATAITSFFRGLGGAVGAAVLGAVFAAHAGLPAAQAGIHPAGAGARAAISGAVQSVFIVAAPVAALGLLIVLRLPALQLRSDQGSARAARQDPRGAAPAGREAGETP